MNFYGLVVGETFKSYENQPLPLKNHCKLTLSPTGNLLLVMCLKDITPEEIEMIATMPVFMRLFEHSSGFLLPVFRFGQSDMIIEAPFDPIKHGKERICLMRSDTGMVMIAVEASTNTIVGKRACILPATLNQKLKSSWLTAFKNKTVFTMSYTGWIKSVQSTLLMSDLWRFAGEQVEVCDSMDDGTHSFASVLDKAANVNHFGICI